MVAVATDEHPKASVPVTLYVVLKAGEASTLAPLVELKPAAGDQLYVIAPEAVKVTGEPPAQMFAEFGLTLTVGAGFIVTVACPIPGQPLPLFPVTV